MSLYLHDHPSVCHNITQQANVSVIHWIIGHLQQLPQNNIPGRLNAKNLRYLIDIIAQCSRRIHILIHQHIHQIHANCPQIPLRRLIITSICTIRQFLHHLRNDFLNIRYSLYSNSHQYLLQLLQKR